MKQLIISILIIISLRTFGQETEESILYVVDSIAIIDDPKEDEGSLANNEIESITVVTDKVDIENYGYKDIDKIIFIFTKEYAIRPDSIKKIPTFKKMVKNGSSWCLKGETTPYTGQFIDYYSNGKKYREGFLKDGLLENLRTLYFKNGQQKAYGYFTSGKLNGDYGEYFPNGQLQQQGVFKNGKEEGLWKEWYSTGVLKKEIEYKDGKPILTKEIDKLNSFFTKGLKSQEEGNYKAAIKFYDRAIELDSNFSDLYFHRSRAYLYDFQFDKAITDCDKAIEIEPMYKEAYSNRAFSRIRKYEFSGSRILESNSEVTVLAGKKQTEIPTIEKDNICTDLKMGFELGDTQEMITDAIKTYCQ